MPCALQHNGWCARCRVLWTWEGKLQQRNACCPDCGASLMHKPGAKAIGRHRIEARLPREREKPALVLKEIDYAQ